MSSCCGSAMLAEFFSSGHAADLVLAVMFLEGCVLCWVRRHSGKGPNARDIVIGLLPGACLVLALRGALVGAWWGWIALALSASLLAHLADLRLRRA